MRAAQARPRGAAPLALSALAAAAAALALLGDSAPPHVPAPERVEPLRIVSGNGIATGFAVADGRVVTVAHVLDGPVTVRGRPVTVLRIDRRNDLALLSAPGVRAVAPNTASAADGEHLRVVRLRAGRSSSVSARVRRSIVAHVRAHGAAPGLVRPALELSVLESRGPVAPGDSGAPVVTGSGDVAGIVFAASRNWADRAYAVDASRLRRLIRRSSVE